MEKSEKGFVVSARKYRPSNWDEVIGQEAITETLKSSIADNHLAHAYLFCGPRGVGKTTCARIFAREINTTDAKEDDDFSFNVFELDAASNNKVDDIRQLTDQVRIPPQTGNYKVYIIDEVHMLSSQAFNAFLKTLEEPPSHAIFILATTEKHKIIPTILSRCQIYDFSRISVDEIVKQLEDIAKSEKVTADDAALHVIAQKADGAMRDALSIFDQLVSFTHGNLTYEAVLKNLHVLDYDYFFKLTTHLLGRDYAQAMLSLDEILNLGFDASHFIAGLGDHFRDLLVCKNESTISLLEVSESIKVEYLNQANSVETPWLLSGLNTIQQAEFKIKQSMNPRLLIEVTLLNIANHSTEKKKLSESSEAPNETIRESGKLAPANIKKPEKTQQTDEQEQKNTHESKSVAASETTPSPTRSVEVENPERPIKEVTKENNATSEHSMETQQRLDRKRRRATKTISIQDTEVASTADESSTVDEPIVELSETINEAVQKLSISEAWAKALKQVESDKNNTLLTILSRTKINEADSTLNIRVELEHSVEQAEFDLHRTELLESLRSLSGEQNLQLTSVQVEQTQTTKLFTPKDKFEHLASKNPNLKKLRERLDLDVTF